MIRFAKGFIAFILLALWIFLASGSNETSRTTFHTQRYFDECSAHLKGIKEQLESNNPNPKIILETFKEARLAYKRLEPITSYVLPNMESLLNGAPLMSLYSDGMAAEANYPEGFQVLEETLFAEKHVDKSEAIELIDRLVRRLDMVEEKLSRHMMTDRQRLEIARQQIIRINTMTISGFDSPVLAHSIPEAMASLTTCYEVIKPYLNHQNPLQDSVDRQFDLAIEYLDDHQNFNAFDRVEFTRNFSDPLYGSLYRLHRQMDIETIDQVTRIPQRVNYHAESLFDNDFLDPNSFSRFGNDPQSDKKVALGKVLFYDPILSGNNKRACASCHAPDKGFGDGLAKSRAFDMQGFVDRNSPTLLNSAYQNEFFWDLRSEHLNNQMDHVVMSPKEFHTNYTEILNKLRSSEEYVQLFEDAYQSDRAERTISTTAVKQVLSYYVKSLSSFNSPFDQYMRRESDELDQDAIAGYNLFMGKAACGTCHFVPSFFGTVPPHFVENEGEVLGTPATAQNQEWDDDLGRYNQFLYYNYDFLQGQFKTPTVRNAAITGPYMHNGVYSSLEEVVDFYNAGGGEGMGFDIPVQTLPADSLHLSDKEKKQIIAFMNSLTDTSVDLTLPKSLPTFPDSLQCNNRKIGGEY